jgi:hypothetical protein
MDGNLRFIQHLTSSTQHSTFAFPAILPPIGVAACSPQQVTRITDISSARRHRLSMNRNLIALTLAILVPAAMASPRAIPGINAKDAYPAACVDCHVKDMRLSTQIARWNGSVDAKSLAAMQAFAPKGMTLKGKHPPVTGKDIPASCLKCHAAMAKAAPPLAPLLHGIHLAKGDQSDFVKQFQGECTHCHKLNKTTGTWSMPSGTEK